MKHWFLSNDLSFLRHVPSYTVLGFVRNLTGIGIEVVITSAVSLNRVHATRFQQRKCEMRLLHYAVPIVSVTITFPWQLKS